MHIRYDSINVYTFLLIAANLLAIYLLSGHIFALYESYANLGKITLI